MAPAAYMHAHGEGLLLDLHVQPNARQSSVEGVHGERLKVKIASPPVDGKANREVCRFLAELFGVAKSAVSIERGASSRAKQVLVRGVSREQAAGVLAGAGVSHA